MPEVNALELIERAEALFGDGDAAAAETLLDEALAAITCESLRARALGDLAVIAVARHDGRLATERAARALAADSGNVSALEALAQVSREAGDVVGATHWIERAAAAQPDDEHLWRSLGELLAERGRLDAARDAYGHAGGCDAEVAAIDERAALRSSAMMREGVGRPGRVLIAVDFFHPSIGGSEKLAEDLAASLRERGWQPEVATRALPARTNAEHRGIPIHEIDGDALAGLASVVAAGAFDAVVALSGPVTWPVVAALSLPHPRPRVLVVPCVNADGYAQVSGDANVRARYAGLLAGADVVGRSSDTSFDARLCEELGCPSVYLPNATPDLEPRGDFRAEHGIPADAPLLVMVGNMWPEKDHRGLLEVLAADGGDWRLAILGGASSHHPELADDVRRLAARDPRVTLAGGVPRETVAAALHEASALLLPSRVEATPLVVLEAMSAGLPWVATPTCGAVHDHAGGLIVPIGQFPAAARFLVEDAEASMQLGAAGRAHWEMAYTWETVAARYHAALTGAAPVAGPQAPGDALRSTDAVRGRFCEQLVDAAAADPLTV